MLKVLFWTSISVVFFSVFQASVLSGLILLPALPDFVLLIVLYISFMNSSVIGSTSGFISGLLLDFLSSAPIGLNAFVKCITGYFTGKLTGMFNLNKIIIPCLMAIGATFFKAITIWFLSFFFGSEVLTYMLFGKTLYAEILLNAFFAPVIFGLLSAFKSLFVVQDI